jgi:hypothetical protein
VYFPCLPPEPKPTPEHYEVISPAEEDSRSDGTERWEGDSFEATTTAAAAHLRSQYLAPAAQEAGADSGLGTGIARVALGLGIIVTASALSVVMGRWVLIAVGLTCAAVHGFLNGLRRPQGRVVNAVPGAPTRAAVSAKPLSDQNSD